MDERFIHKDNFSIQVAERIIHVDGEVIQMDGEIIEMDDRSIRVKFATNRSKK